MARPKSILLFERLYLASFLIGIVSTIQNWSVRERMLERNASTMNLDWLAPGATVLGVVIALALWYVVARLGHVVGKWIVMALAAWGGVLILMLCYGLATGRGALASLLVGIAQNVLYLAAAAMLLRPDARRWFGEESVA
mgnify:CR=1 FL=1